MKMKISADSMAETLSLGVDTTNRTIYLIGVVDDEMTARFMIAFRALDAVKGPIRIVLNSGGGSEPAGFAIYDILKLARNPVTIDCYGLVQSIAALILQAAKRRRMSPECRFMIHNGHLELPGHPVYQGTIVAISRETEKMTARYKEILAESSGASAKNIKKWCDDERYFSAHETVTLGFADEVIDSPEKVELPKTKRRRGAVDALESAIQISEEEFLEILGGAAKPGRRKPRKRKQ